MDESQKVDAFPTPHFLSGGTSGIDVGVSAVFPVIFAVVFFIWVVYTVTVAYHWFRYGHQSFLAVPLLILHVVISGTLLLLAAAGIK